MSRRATSRSHDPSHYEPLSQVSISESGRLHEVLQMRHCHYPAAAADHANTADVAAS